MEDGGRGRTELYEGDGFEGFLRPDLMLAGLPHPERLDLQPFPCAPGGQAAGPRLPLPGPPRPPAWARAHYSRYKWQASE